MQTPDTIASRILAGSSGLEIVERATTELAMQREGVASTISNEVLLSAVTEAVAQIAQRDTIAFQKMQRSAELKAIGLRALGLVVDVFAQGLEGEPEHGYEPGKTPLRKMINSNDQDKRTTTSGDSWYLQAKTVYDTNIVRESIATELGDVRPIVQIKASLDALRTTRRSYRRLNPGDIDIFGPGGGILAERWGLKSIALSTQLYVVPVGGETITTVSAEMPAVNLRFDGNGQLLEFHSFIANDQHKARSNVALPLDTERAHLQLDTIESLIQGVAYRPGTEGIKQYLDLA